MGRPKLSWVSQPETKNANLTYAISSGKDGSIYTLGIFLRNIKFGSYKLLSNGNAVFLNKIWPDGCYQWAIKICDYIGNLGIMSLDVTDNIFIECQSFDGSFTFEHNNIFNPPQNSPVSFVANIDICDGIINYALASKSIGGVGISSNKNYGYITGSYNGISHPGLPNLISGQYHSLYVSKFNKDGFLWGKSVVLNGIEKCTKKCDDCEIISTVVSSSISYNKTHNIISGMYTGKVYFDNMKAKSNSNFSNGFLAIIDNNSNWTRLVNFESPCENNIMNMSVDYDENIYTIGNFVSMLEMNEYKISATENYAHFFICKFNNKLDLLFLEMIKISQPIPKNCNSNLNIVTRENGVSYIFGNFLGKIVLGNLSLKSNIVSSFLAKVDTDGTFNWAITIEGFNCDNTIQNTIAVTSDMIYLIGVGQRITILDQCYETKRPYNRDTSFLIAIYDE